MQYMKYENKPDNCISNKRTMHYDNTNSTEVNKKTRIQFVLFETLFSHNHWNQLIQKIYQVKQKWVYPPARVRSL